MYVFKIELLRGYLKSETGKTKYIKQIIDKLNYYNKNNIIIKNVNIKYIKESEINENEKENN